MANCDSVIVKNFSEVRNFLINKIIKFSILEFKYSIIKKMLSGYPVYPVLGFEELSKDEAYYHSKLRYLKETAESEFIEPAPAHLPLPDSNSRQGLAVKNADAEWIRDSLISKI